MSEVVDFKKKEEEKIPGTLLDVIDILAAIGVEEAQTVLREYVDEFSVVFNREKSYFRVVCVPDKMGNSEEIIVPIYLNELARLREILSEGLKMSDSIIMYDPVTYKYFVSDKKDKRCAGESEYLFIGAGNTKEAMRILYEELGIEII